MRFSLSNNHLTRAAGNRLSKIQIIHNITFNIFLLLLIHSRTPWSHFQTNPLTQGTMWWWHQCQHPGNTKSTKNWAPGSSFPFPCVQLLAGTGAYLALLFFSTCRKNFNGQWGSKPNTCWRLYYSTPQLKLIPGTCITMKWAKNIFISNSIPSNSSSEAADHLNLFDSFPVALMLPMLLLIKTELSLILPIN